MIGVTIGCGVPWNFLAMKAAESCERSTGLSTYVLGDFHAKKYGVSCPHHLKFHLLDEFPGETILYFDADCLFLKPWSVPFGGFRAVKDDLLPGMKEELQALDLPTDAYFNSGVMIIPPGFDPVLKTAKSLAGSFKSIFRDQTYLNLAVRMHNRTVRWLDRRFNRIHFRPRDDPEDTVVAHFMDIENGQMYDIVRAFS